METRLMCSNEVEIIFDFPSWLREQLNTRKMSISRLAKISGVHPNTIQNYLSNKCEPTLFNARCVMNALGYDLGAIPR